MNRFATAAVLFAFTAALGMPVHAEGPSAADDIRAGRALALKVCAFCHVVAPKQDMPPILDPPAPSFRSIANKRGATAESIRRFLKETHSSVKTLNNMPNPEITEDQAREAAAFIMSLRERR